MKPPLRLEQRVAWHDTDAAGIAHFTAFLRYMEMAEHELLRQLGLSVLQHDADGALSWPRVHVECDFQGAARFDDLLTIDVSVARLGESSVSYQFEIGRDGTPIARGLTTAVCCRMTAGQPPKSLPIPAPIAATLRTALQTS